MRDFDIRISNMQPQECTVEAGMVEEIGATRLVITLDGEMAENDIDYYVLDFELPSPLRRVKSCRIYEGAESGESYRIDNVIYCVLWQELTNAPRIRFQVEAYRLKDDEVKSVTRSGMVTLNLLQGISGEEGTADTGVHGILAELHTIQNNLSGLSSAATALYNQTNSLLENIVEQAIDGIDIHIGENGNWYAGDEDLEMPAQGATGETGATGEASYVHIRYGTSATPETLLTSPNDYIGIYSGAFETAPTTYEGYTWYKFKGETGVGIADADIDENGHLILTLNTINIETLTEESILINGGVPSDRSGE